MVLGILGVCWVWWFPGLGSFRCFRFWVALGGFGFIASLRVRFLILVRGGVTLALVFCAVEIVYSDDCCLAYELEFVSGLEFASVIWVLLG